MKEFKGTKGEFKVLNEFRNVKILNESNQPMFESNINCFDDEDGMCKYYSHNKIMANANLFATAPELLRLLIKVKEDLKLEWGPKEWKEFDIQMGYSEIIAKALGNETN
ncbi:hypothetical protein Harreka1_42 [Olleya phage Harreka_1]|uniref:Uncharacterized protein n=1 Tax=Olleya phage Harreka_1 TaxID=2745673 RepID=A0A8E4ZFA9_9CAUD|nr:hypothetical protein M1M26_gp42 [Olleya phage Harreka_1]QQV90449.1 hypothetical protein Harreka1_42 [Olleya phage Harreka_1]